MLDQFRALEPKIKAHAENYARAYFAQFKKSENQLIRGPDSEAGVHAFGKETPLPDWGEENELKVFMAVSYRYNEYLEREYHRLLIRELLEGFT